MALVFTNSTSALADAAWVQARRASARQQVEAIEQGGARGTFDVAKRKAAYDQAVAILVEECPSVFIAHVNEHKVLAKHVQGFQPIPADLMNMHTVWFDKA
jgi:hypothetical protein